MEVTTQNRFKMENISIQEKIINRMCRLCLSNDGTIDMFSFSSELACQITDAVTKCTSVHVEKYSELPSAICESCYMQLIKTQKFQMQALKSDRTLLVYLKRLRGDDEKNILRSSLLHDNDGNSCIETNAANQDKEDNSTNCEEIEPCVKYSENACEQFEMDDVENKVFIFDSNSHTEWDVNSSRKDFDFNPDLIVKAEPIINEEENQFDIDTKILIDFAVTQRNIKLENEVSIDKGTLRTHQRVHTIEKTYQCDVCNKMFNRSDHLRNHQRVHTGEKPYQCDVCNKYFSYSSTLRCHERVHTGEKLYQCDVCNKSFSRVDNLRTHQRVHSGEKPYRCDVCNKSFSRLDNLKTHERVHSGEKPCQCDVCNKCFSQLSNLNSHKRTHSSDF